MSREIKFRVFAKSVKTMLYFDNPRLVMCDFYEGPGYGMGLRMVDGHAYLGKYSDLMQYTGEHDCKGKEIYEGDIVRIEKCEILAEIAWCLYPLAFKLVDRHGIVMLDYLRDIGSGDIEVVGNVHDNPEMLGGADNAQSE